MEEQMTNVKDTGGYVNEIAQIKAEIAARDYRALKAYKLGVELESLYPGETAWYERKLAKIQEFEGLILQGDQD
jgi:hypothetical protein